MDVKFTPHFQTKIPAHLFSKSVNINPACLNTDKFVHYPSTFGPKLIKSVSFVITTTITHPRKSPPLSKREGSQVIVLVRR